LIADQETVVRPKNWLAPVALVILREQTSYGYELMERIEEFGFKEINPGTMYRKLRQMEREGLCKSVWETSGSGPARRLYSVTVEGEAYLRPGQRGARSTNT
jgi:PadR family transcriptional regulator PadR